MAELIRSGRIDDDAAQFAKYDFETWWARDGQLPPEKSQGGSAWQVWLALAGRGFGKTRMGAEFAIAKARAGLGPGAIVGRTAADSRHVLVEGPSGILACSPPWFRPKYEPGIRKLTWPNGVTAQTFAAEAPDQLRGPQHNWAVADELAAWSYIEEAWSNLMFGLRLGDQPQVAALTTPRPLDLIKQMLADGETAITRGSTLDNVMNLAKSAVDHMVKRYAGTRLGQQELEGILLDDLPNALWPEAVLRACLLPPNAIFTPDHRAQFERIVVGLDPSGNDAKSEDLDAAGIVVAGKLKTERGAPEQYVVLEDDTEPRTPNEWAKAACMLRKKWDAALIVAEANFGGEMVRATLMHYDRSAPVRIKHTSKAKWVRAEPVAMLYEQGKVKHNPNLTRLESELKQFTTRGYEGGASPNRADAAVWALDELGALSLNQPRVRSL